MEKIRRPSGDAKCAVCLTVCFRQSQVCRATHSWHSCRRLSNTLRYCTVHDGFWRVLWSRTAAVVFSTYAWSSDVNVSSIRFGVDRGTKLDIMRRSNMVDQTRHQEMLGGGGISSSQSHAMAVEGIQRFAQSTQSAHDVQSTTHCNQHWCRESESNSSVKMEGATRELELI